MCGTDVSPMSLSDGSTNAMRWKLETRTDELCVRKVKRHKLVAQLPASSLDELAMDTMTLPVGCNEATECWDELVGYMQRQRIGIAM